MRVKSKREISLHVLILVIDLLKKFLAKMPSQRTTGYVTAVLPEPFVVFFAGANADVRFDVSGADDLEKRDGSG